MFQKVLDKKTSQKFLDIPTLFSLIYLQNGYSKLSGYSQESGIFCVILMGSVIKFIFGSHLGYVHMEDRNQLQRQLKVDTNNAELRERYKTAKTHVKTLINKSKSEHYQGRLKDYKGDTSAVWKVIGEIVPNQKKKT